MLQNKAVCVMPSNFLEMLMPPRPQSDGELLLIMCLFPLLACKMSLWAHFS